MTDGIIQEVFNPLIKWHTSHNDTDFANTLKLIEKELIEKIKQKKIEISNFTWSGYSDGVNSLVEELIGDNQ